MARSVLRGRRGAGCRLTSVASGASVSFAAVIGFTVLVVIVSVEDRVVALVYDGNRGHRSQQ